LRQFFLYRNVKTCKLQVFSLFSAFFQANHGLCAQPISVYCY
jgi:hypothetical protein